MDVPPNPKKYPWYADSYRGPFSCHLWVKVSAAGKIEKVIPIQVSDPVLIAYMRQQLPGWPIRPARRGWVGPGGRELTLIETETLEALPALGVKVSAAETRRNVATAGVPLNHLVGREFRVGAVRLRGTRLCEPCKYLEGLTQAGAMLALLHRGGLRAQILNDGVIRVGDTIQPA